MIHHRFYHKKMNLVPDAITVSEAALVFAYNVGDRDYFNVTVQPLGLRWGTTIQDTGDGTNWVAISVSDHTGFIIDAYVRAALENTTGFARSANVRFYSISEDAPDVNVSVTQFPEPI